MKSPNRRDVLRASAAAAALAVSPQLAEANTSKPARPNIVLILADDLGAEALSCYGNQSCATPQLDRLATEGLRFENAHVVPVCSPTRAELLTGRYCFRTGLTDVILPGQKGKRLDCARHRTVARFLRDSGYATSISGKWHLCYDFADNPTHVADAGFDDRYLWRLFRDDKVTRNLWDPELWVDDKPADELGKDKYGPDLFCDHVVEFIKAHREQPFFIYYPMVLVHSQTATGHNFPKTPDTLKPGEDRHGGGKEGTAEGNARFVENVAYMDKIVGKVDRALRDAGVRDNTILIFLGDNGTNQNTVTRYKGRDFKGGKLSLTESGTRVPLIVNWPGAAKGGRVIADLIDGTDLMPTILQAAGVALPDGYGIDGKSFLPQVKSPKGEPREWVYKHFRQNWMIRDNRYRLDSDGRLWDLSEDPYAPRPAADSPESTAARTRLEAAAKEIQQRKM